jgi:hypothetical protein
MKINQVILSLTVALVGSILVGALQAHTDLANAELNMKKSSTTCDGDTCHTVVCVNNNCQSSSTNSTNAASKIIQNSSIP